MKKTKKVAVWRRTLSLYWQHVRLRRKQFSILVILTVLAIISGQVMTPLIASIVLNKLSTGQLDSIDPYVWLLAAYGLVLFLELVFWRVQVYIIWRYETSVMQEIMERVFRHIIHQSNRFHTNRFGGSLVSQSNKFVGSFERLNDVFFFEILTTVTYFASIIIVLLFQAPLYAPVLIIGSAVYLLILIKRSKVVQPLNIASAKSESDNTAQLADSITNIGTIKAFAHETMEEKLFHIKTEHTRQSSLRLMREQIKNDAYFNSITSSVGWMALAFAVIATVQFGASLGIVLLIVNYTGNAMRRLWEMSRVARNLNRAFGDAYEMTEILDLKPEITDNKGAVRLVAGRGDLRFRDVRFAYPEQPDEPLFNNFDLHIKPGEKIGLVGHSGSGKTTLSRLILRFMDVTDGSIEIDNQNIADATQESLRKSISYVPQEPLMFHRSIADNIRYGELDAPDEQVIAAAKMSNAHDFIEKLPKGYDTLVGERGTKLSGGQRQRIAIARAMIKNAPILILDEATSALDSESEQLIQDALWRLMEGRTAIVIAHRLSTIQKMDRILVMHDGEIIEEGSHKELVRQDGIYANLWSRQSGGFLED